MKYNIISTGSKGNSLIINDFLMLDCGVSFKKIKPFYKKLNLVFIGHIHGDHFNKTCVKTLAKERPILRFAVGEWLVSELIECGVDKRNIDVIEAPKIYDYGSFKISPIVLYHDVKNYGLRIFINNEKAIYITDTSTVEGITAKNYNCYFLEANYQEKEIQERIKSKQENGHYIYEFRTMKTHLSKEQADTFLIENMGENSKYIYLHQHEERA